MSFQKKIKNKRYPKHRKKNWHFPPQITSDFSSKKMGRLFNKFLWQANQLKLDQKNNAYIMRQRLFEKYMSIKTGRRFFLTFDMMTAHNLRQTKDASKDGQVNNNHRSQKDKEKKKKNRIFRNSLWKTSNSWGQKSWPNSLTKSAASIKELVVPNTEEQKEWVTKLEKEASAWVDEIISQKISEKAAKDQSKKSKARLKSIAQFRDKMQALLSTEAVQPALHRLQVTIKKEQVKQEQWQEKKKLNDLEKWKADLKEHVENFLENRPFKNESFSSRLRQWRKRKLVKIMHQLRNSPERASKRYKPWNWKAVGQYLMFQKAYAAYKDLSLKDRRDFFRTYVGQMILNLYTGSKQGFSKKELQRRFYKAHWKGWWYENLVKKRRASPSVEYYRLEKPNTAFHFYWGEEKREPWRSSLVFKRAFYSGFSETFRKETRAQRQLNTKPYLRSRNPRREKRNNLYKAAYYLLKNFRQRRRIRRNKHQRIKQVAYKVLSPFYGHLRRRQTQKIVKKSKKIKSQRLTAHEIILSHFENRLDVVVYRLNLAPNILWARRLIKAGLIFVRPAQSSLLWESMYSGFKKISFPLKLRDPKNLYQKTYWERKKENWVEFKFLGQPQKKISYLLQAGDLIQCAPGAAINNFQTQDYLSRKPIPSHLLVRKSIQNLWHWNFQTWHQRNSKRIDHNFKPIEAAFFLHSPQYRQLHPHDRAKESFLRWAMM